MDSYDVSTITLSLMMVIQKQQIAKRQVLLLVRKQCEMEQRLYYCSHLGTLYSQQLSASVLSDVAYWFSTYIHLQSCLSKRITQMFLNNDSSASYEALTMAIDTGSNQLSQMTRSTSTQEDDHSQDAPEEDDDQADIQDWAEAEMEGVFPLDDGHDCMSLLTNIPKVNSRSD